MSFPREALFANEADVCRALWSSSAMNRRRRSLVAALGLFASFVCLALPATAAPTTAEPRTAPALGDAPPPGAVASRASPHTRAESETATSVELGKGATIRAKDGLAELNIRARIQLQGAYETNAEDPKTGLKELPDTDFLIRRLRLLLQGHALTKQLRYYFQFGFSFRDQEPDRLTPLRDARLEWSPVRDFNVWGGQMKVPFNRERVISSSALGMVDRSNVNAELNLDRDVGMMLTSKDLFGTRGILRYYAGVFGGDGRNRNAGAHGLLWVGRVEVAPFGRFEDYSEVDFERSTKPKLSMGVATAYNENTFRTRSTHSETFKYGAVDYRHACADMIFKIYGFSLQAEALYRRGDKAVVGTGTDSEGKPVVEAPRNAWGFFVQSGMRVFRGLDLNVRYGEVRPLDATNKRMVRDREIGGAVSYYFQKHDLKLQLDYFHLLAGSDPAETRVIERDRVRIQAQLYF